MDQRQPYPQRGGNRQAYHDRRSYSRRDQGYGDNNNGGHRYGNYGNNGYNDRRSRSSNEQPRCSFYDRVGACRHGALCSRRHVKPQTSNTVVFWKMFDNPRLAHENASSDSKYEFKVVSPEELKQVVDDLFMDVVSEMSKFGRVMEVAICCNRNTHLTGNVYVRFDSPGAADACFKQCNNRWYNNKPLYSELSPVQNIEDAICGEYLDRGECSRGSGCNFMHTRLPSKEALQKVFDALYV